MPKVNKKIPKIKELISSIEQIFDSILKAERSFLIESRKNKHPKDFCPTEEHNNKIDVLAYDIDKKIYELVECSKEDISSIESNIRANDIYLPDLSFEPMKNTVN